MSVFDTVIRHGTVIDGTGQPRRRADVGLVADRVAQIGDLADASAQRTIDASGRVVAPGFVDVHNHSDGWLLTMPDYAPKTRQGFTTEVIMADGISYAPADDRTRADWIYYVRGLNALLFAQTDRWCSLSDYMARMDGQTAQNAITHIPFGNVRALACGWSRTSPDDFQLDEMLAQVRQGMEAGAVGISTGLDYLPQCFASTDELVEVCRAMAPWGGLYASHVRYRKTIVGGLQEAVAIGRRAGVAVHISHLKASKPADIDAVLHYIDHVAVNEVDFSFDVYPYLPGCTMLNYMLPYEVWEDGPLAVPARLREPEVRARFGRSLASYPLDQIRIAWLPGRDNEPFIGKRLSDYVAAVGRSPGEALSDLLIEENLAVLLVFHHGDDALVHPFLSHERYMMGTDGIYFPGAAVHPRLYGSAPRLLGPCVRQHRLFSLEAAVRKLSGFPAERFGLQDRGVLRPGAYADVVVFDPETVADRATYDDPHQFPAGIDHVWVNGVPVVEAGGPAPALPTPRPGRWLRYRR
jgi:N-acyl-D-amino-acid deacylase